MEQRVVTAQVKQSSVAGWRVSKLGCALSALSHLPNKHIVTDAQGAHASALDQHRRTVNNMTAGYKLEGCHPSNTSVDCGFIFLLASNVDSYVNFILFS